VSHPELQQPAAIGLRICASVHTEVVHSRREIWIEDVRVGPFLSHTNVSRDKRLRQQLRRAENGKAEGLAHKLP
jgi:hypothetical protein